MIPKLKKNLPQSMFIREVINCFIFCLCKNMTVKMSAIYPPKKVNSISNKYRLLLAGYSEAKLVNPDSMNCDKLSAFSIETNIIGITPMSCHPIIKTMSTPTRYLHQSCFHLKACSIYMYLFYFII